MVSHVMLFCFRVVSPNILVLQESDARQDDPFRTRV